MAKILLVEDEAGIQLAMRGLLRRDGHEVEVVGVGQAALRAIEDHDFDLILTDLSLPDGVSGLDVAARARELRPETPVVLITAYGSDDVAQKAAAAGVAGYVPKPFDNNEVRSVVRQMLETDPRRR